MLDQRESRTPLPASRSEVRTRIPLAIVFLLWIGLLVAAAGANTNTWFLLAVDSIGIVRNVLMADWRRDSSALVLHLEFRGVHWRDEDDENITRTGRQIYERGKRLVTHLLSRGVVNA